MALFPCPECGREVSTDAKACPSCGKDLRFAGAGERWRAMPKAGKAFIVAAPIFFIFVLWLERLPKADKPAQPAATVASQAAPTAKNKAMTVQPGQWFGFRDRELLDKATRIAVQGDKEAWARIMTQSMQAGAITLLKPGEEVHVEDSALLGGVVKVRRKGETNGWWTEMEAVK